MKYFFNGFLGGFSRSLGRIVAYLVIGALAYILLSRADLGIINVYAAEISDSGSVYSANVCGLNGCSVVGGSYIVGDNTPYVWLNTNEYIDNFYIFPTTPVGFQEGHNYTIKFLYNTGGAVANTLDFNLSNRFVFEPLVGDNWLQGGYNNFSIVNSFNNSTFEGTLSISFKCEVNTTRYRLTIREMADRTPVFVSYYSGLQGVRVHDIFINDLGTNSGGGSSDSGTSTIINQNETIINQNQQIIDKTNEINDTLNSTDTSSSENTAIDFFTNFQDNDHGLASIITAPLDLIRNLSTSTCNPLVLPLPFVNKNATLSCMKPIYQEHFGSFYNLWQTITTGLIAYSVLLNFFKKIREIKNPNSDKVEVLDL